MNARFLTVGNNHAHILQNILFRTENVYGKDKCMYWILNSVIQKSVIPRKKKMLSESPACNV